MLDIAELEALVAAQMAAAHVPGLALAIVREGVLAYARGFGVTSVEDGGGPVTPDTLFRIGSLNKPQTATMVMRLVERGDLDLDRPIAEYLPWFALSEPGAAALITLRHLLTHTAGLPTDGMDLGSHRPPTLEQYVREMIPRYPLLAPPGVVCAYSNAGFNVAGYVAEAVTGVPYPQLMDKLLFGPLGMARTIFDPAVALTYPLALPHELDDLGMLRVRHRLALNPAYAPCGETFSTARDQAAFALLHLHDGRAGDQHLLATGSLAAMHRAQADLYTAGGWEQGLGFGVRTVAGRRQLGHGGAIDTYGSSIFLAPDDGAAVVLLYNHRARLGNAVMDHAVEALIGTPPTSRAPVTAVREDPTRWPAFVGTFAGQWSGLATIVAREGRLVLERDDTTVTLHARGRDRYAGDAPDGATVTVGFTGPEDAAAFCVIDGVPHERIAMPAREAFNPAAWRRYAGTYSDGLRVRVLRVAEDGLFLHHNGHDREVACIPLADGRLVSEFGLCEFLTDSSGTPSLRLARTFILAAEGGDRIDRKVYAAVLALTIANSDKQARNR